MSNIIKYSWVTNNLTDTLRTGLSLKETHSRLGSETNKRHAYGEIKVIKSTLVGIFNITYDAHYMSILEHIKVLDFLIYIYLDKIIKCFV